MNGMRNGTALAQIRITAATASRRRVRRSKRREGGMLGVSSAALLFQLPQLHSSRLRRRQLVFFLAAHEHREDCGGPEWGDIQSSGCSCAARKKTSCRRKNYYYARY